MDKTIEIFKKIPQGIDLINEFASGAAKYSFISKKYKIEIL